MGHDKQKGLKNDLDVKKIATCGIKCSALKNSGIIRSTACDGDIWKWF